MRLRTLEGIGDHTLLALVREWHSPDAVLAAPADELVQRGCSPRLAEVIRRGPDRDACRRIARELDAITRKRISVRTILDPAYPSHLRTIADPPPLLYVSGSLEESDQLAVAVVGARRATPAGQLITERLANELAAAVHHRQRLGARG